MIEHGWSVRHLERAIATAALTRAAPVEGRDRRAALARELTERAASSIDVPVEVRARGDGFTVRLHTADQATAESVLARLARDPQA